MTSSTTRSPLLPLGVGAAALVVLAIVHRGFLSDDANILLAFADHLVRDGQAALNPGQPVHAISTPLWFGLAWAIQSLVDDPATGLTWLRIASTLSALLCVALLLLLVRRHGGGLGAQLLAVILVVADPWFGRWITSGMETAAAAAVVLGALLLRSSERDLPRLCAPLLALSAGVLLRPELAVLGLLLLGELVLARRDVLARLSPLKTGALSMAAALPVAGWLALSHAWFGTVIPQTALVKADVMSGPEVAFRASQVVLAGQAAALGVLAIAALVAWRSDAPRSGRRPTVALLLCWPTLLILFYALRGHEPLSRYLLLGTVCLPAAAALVADRLPRAGIPVAIVAALILGASVSALRVVSASSGETVRFHREVAAWMGEHAEPGDAVASWEIGTLALFGDHEVIDLAGLVLPPDLLPLRGTPELLQATRPRFSLHRFEIEGVRYEARLRRTVDRSDVAGGREPVELVLWELTWDASR